MSPLDEIGFVTLDEKEFFSKTGDKLSRFVDRAQYSFFGLILSWPRN
jgi:hypothetical protein